MRWLSAATAFVSPAVLAAGIQVDVIPNFIGAGLGVTTEWLSPSWYAGGGVFWQRITGDGAESPIITQRGERDQVTAGIGLGYSW
jgi:MipA family protein